MDYRITDDIDRLKEILPPSIVMALEQIGRDDALVEVVMDLGRLPTARFTDGSYLLSDTDITIEELDYVVSRISVFDADNRGGIERTLHRISAIRNRAGDVVGLTCRVGRAVFGTIDIIEDIIQSGRSVLILGAPGVGKTTMLREAARVLADSRRVVIVDTSNEIGGDGDIPHPAIGLSRRMQVAQPALQHEVMIEAVENHNPQVIIIDEIGRELEAQAARTIAERGVQLIGTAHGNSLENLLRNPTLSDLVGGVQAVTLSDEEARRRRTQKTVLERRSPPTFDVLIEIQDRQQMLIHIDVGTAVDGHLRGRPLPAEVRYRNDDGQIYSDMVVPVLETNGNVRQGGRDGSQRPIERPNGNRNAKGKNGRHKRSEDSFQQQHEDEYEARTQDPKSSQQREETVPPTQVYAYGVAHNRLLEAAERLGVSIAIVDDMTSADVLLTVKSYYRRRPKIIVDAERRNIPIHVLRANTETQVENFLSDIFELGNEKELDPIEAALHDVRQAIRKIRGGTPSIDLKPQASHIRRRQHELVRAANLASHSYGREPNRHVRIFHDELN